MTGIDKAAQEVSERERKQTLWRDLDVMGRSFFSGQGELKREVIAGLVREAQIALIAGPFGVGKSWILADLAVHVALGLDWCGRKTQRRPVVIFDFENSGPAYRLSIKNILHRLDAERPKDLLVHLANDTVGEEGTRALLELGEGGGSSLEYLDRVLTGHPNALVIIDPFELFCSFDMLSGSEVARVYRKLRVLLGKYPEASVITSFNLRKKDRRVSGANLLKDPADWLENVSGTLNILNRADVRLGIEAHKSDGELRVVNGVRRGEEMHPIFLRSVGEPPDGLAGFQAVMPDEIDFVKALTPKQETFWMLLPAKYRFEEVADKQVPRGSLSRLHTKALSVGMLEHHDGVFQKVVQVVP